MADQTSALSVHGLSTPKIIGAAFRMAREVRPNLTGKYLDIGSGNGELIALMKQNFPVEASACDYTAELMQIPGQKVAVVDLNTEDLPYESNFFDLITFTEVIEHIEHDRHIIREIYRILKPGGAVIITTPNILNIKSRLRFLFFGFYNLFGPLHVRDSRKYSAGGHINPISYFYLCHALLDAHFKDLRTGIDKKQKSGVLPLIFLWAPIKLRAWFIHRREVRRYQTIDENNEAIVRKMNGAELLLGRTVVVAATK